MTCTEKLLAALRENNAPPWLEILAEHDAYHDFKSESATPCVDLVRDLQKAGLEALAKRAMNGEFDATKEESDAWAKAEDLMAILASERDLDDLILALETAGTWSPDLDTNRHYRLMTLLDGLKQLRKEAFAGK